MNEFLEKVIGRIINNYKTHKIRSYPYMERVGLSHYSFIGNELWVPHFETKQFYKVDLSTLPGIWFCQDFINEEKPIRYGLLWALITPEMADNPEDKLTPFRPIDSVDDVARLSIMDSGTLLSKKMLRWSTYCEAYKKVGIFEMYMHDLERENLTNAPILTVTPKGNGRILCLMPSNNGGKAKQENSSNPLITGLNHSYG